MDNATQLRLPADGPPIKGAAGGDSNIGTGFVYEVQEDQTNIETSSNMVVGTAQNLINAFDTAQSTPTDPLVDTLSASFVQPGVGFAYTAEIAVDVTNNGLDTAIIEMQIDARLDGVNWVNQTKVQQTLPLKPAGGTASIKRCVARLPRKVLNPTNALGNVDFRSVINLLSGAAATVDVNAPPNGGATGVGVAQIIARRVS